MPTLRTLQDALDEIRSSLFRKKATVVATLAVGVNLIADGRGGDPASFPFAITMGAPMAQQTPWPESPGYIVSLALSRDQLLELRRQADELLEAWQ